MPGSAPVFIDEIALTVSSGRGGDGAVSFRREKFIPRGGPDGGDGGRGGHVLLRSTARLNTLAGLQNGRHFRAGPGKAGGVNNRHGSDGESVLIEVPVGTIVRDATRGHVLRDMDRDGIEFAVVSGGDGGVGNKHFASSTNQVPRQSTPGREGETRRLALELRLIADAGLVGLPNAGKSTFLRAVSRARPKVADYPFTTLEPVLGLVAFDDGGGLLLADIPGLIEGAHEGAGLGDRFLRHVARTGVLLHLVDASVGPEVAVEDWRTIRGELEQSGLGLSEKETILAASKVDAADDAPGVVAALREASGRDVVALSSATGEGVAAILNALRQQVAEAHEDKWEAEKAAERAEQRAAGKAGPAQASEGDD